MHEPIETYRGVVYPWHCDQMGHMNVMWYTGKFDEASWNLFAQIGITPSYLRERHRGMVAVRQTIDYTLELLPGDVVFVRSRIVAVAMLGILQREAPSMFSDYRLEPLQDGSFTTRTDHPKV